MSSNILFFSLPDPGSTSNSTRLSCSHKWQRRFHTRIYDVSGFHRRQHNHAVFTHDLLRFLAWHSLHFHESHKSTYKVSIHEHSLDWIEYVNQIILILAILDFFNTVGAMVCLHSQFLNVIIARARRKERILAHHATSSHPKHIFRPRIIRITSRSPMQWDIVSQPIMV